jgi:transcription elongation factor Elf1
MIREVFWQGLVEKGCVKCRGCGEFVDLEEADSINEGVELWNEHVEKCGEGPRQSMEEYEYMDEF